MWARRLQNRILNFCGTKSVERIQYTKMAFTASLRKLLYSLLAIMIVIVMFFYWNQGITKPSFSFFGDIDRMSKSKLVTTHVDEIIAPEKTWTYKCVDNKCVREHYLMEHHNDKRVPFLTCTMKCGLNNHNQPVYIWPQPTFKPTVGQQSSNIKTGANNIKLKVTAPSKSVEKLFAKTFEVFESELKLIEKVNIINLLDKNSNSNSDKDKNSDNKSKSNHKNDNGINNKNNDVNSDSNVNSIDKLTKNKYFKLTDKIITSQFDINVRIFKSPDIYLMLDTDESYNLMISHNKTGVFAEIHANTFFGARHGLSTLQQLIWFDDEDEVLKIINKAHVVDAPKFRFRGLMLDTSRHYFSVESIKRAIIGMSHSKLNRLHWHITDSQSFPFVSKKYPQLAEYGAYSNREVYTHEDIKDIVEFARPRGIQIIPEIDAPAHAGNGWDWGPKYGLGELSLCINQQPWNFYCGEPPCGQLNPKNNNTYMVLQKLYEELLELTGPTDYFHLGGDEVNLDCWGQYFNDTDLRGLWCDFMLQSYQRLKIANKGIPPKVTAVWSSGLTAVPCLSSNSFAVQVWGGSTWQENYDLIQYGFQLIISHVDAWYLDCGFGSWRSAGEGACSPYRSWQNVYKHRPWDTMHLTTLQMKQILGGEACLWTEQVDESVLDSRLWPRASALAERLWSDPVDEHEIDNVPKDVYNRMSVFRTRLLQLGLKPEPIFPKYCSQNQNECI